MLDRYREHQSRNRAKSVQRIFVITSLLHAVSRLWMMMNHSQPDYQSCVLWRLKFIGIVFLYSVPANQRFPCGITRRKDPWRISASVIIVTNREPKNEPEWDANPRPSCSGVDSRSTAARCCKSCGKLCVLFLGPGWLNSGRGLWSWLDE